MERGGGGEGARDGDCVGGDRRLPPSGQAAAVGEIVLAGAASSAVA